MSLRDRSQLKVYIYISNLVSAGERLIMNIFVSVNLFVLVADDLCLWSISGQE